MGRSPVEAVGGGPGVLWSGVTRFKGGDPAAGSPTATLLRLHPNHQPYRGRRPPLRVGRGDFRYNGLSWCDGRCVQGPGTYSPRRADPRLLAIPPSWGRVADPNLN